MLVLINVENEDGLVLLVEHKVGTDERSNQIKRYILGKEDRVHNPGL